MSVFRYTSHNPNDLSSNDTSGFKRPAGSHPKDYCTSLQGHPIVKRACIHFVASHHVFFVVCASIMTDSAISGAVTRTGRQIKCPARFPRSPSPQQQLEHKTTPAPL